MGWNPVKELKDVVNLKSGQVAKRMWNPVKELKGHLTPTSSVTRQLDVESGEGIESSAAMYC